MSMSVTEITLISVKSAHQFATHEVWNLAKKTDDTLEREGSLTKPLERAGSQIVTGVPLVLLLLVLLKYFIAGKFFGRHRRFVETIHIKSHNWSRQVSLGTLMLFWDHQK